jgi:hypothetical protein
MGWVESKSRDLGNDRGYRAVVVEVWVGAHLNPHPLKTEGAAPKIRGEGEITCGGEFGGRAKLRGPGECDAEDREEEERERDEKWGADFAHAEGVDPFGGNDQQKD